MIPLEVAIQYLEIFHSGQDLERLREILADDCMFKGA